MDFETRKRLYNRCDPQESLAPDDDRNVDFDAIGSAPARGVRWVDELAGGIELSDEPTLTLFTGLPGSGKSTELRRLAARLSGDGGKSLVPVFVDAEELLDLASPVDVPDLLAAILYATERKVLEIEGRDPDRAMRDGWFKGIWIWLTETDVTLKEAEFALTDVAKLTLEMRTRPTLRQKVRKIISARLRDFLERVSAELVELEDRAQQRGYRGLLVIVDSLEKLRGTTTNWHAVLASAEQLFAGGAPYLTLPVHVVYTVPPALITRVSGIEFMPMLRLRERSGEDNESGMLAAREMVRQRISDELLAEVLGEDPEPTATELIKWSGGYPRELVRLLREVLKRKNLPATPDDLEIIRTGLYDQTRMLIQADDFAWLARVANTRYFTPDNDKHLAVAARMLQANVVLCYRNHEVWYDLHPAAKQVPGIQEALDELGLP